MFVLELRIIYIFYICYIWKLVTATELFLYFLCHL